MYNPCNASLYHTLDDLSEERLKALWLQAHAPPTDQSDSADGSHDRSQEKPAEATEQNDATADEGGGREGGVNIGGEGEGEREGEGEGEGDGEKVEGVGEKEENAEEEEEAEGEKEVHANGIAPEETVASMDGFAEEPFVHAAAQFLQYDLANLLDLLTQAIEKGASIGLPCSVMHSYSSVHVHYVCGLLQVMLCSRPMLSCCGVLCMLCGGWRVML